MEGLSVTTPTGFADLGPLNRAREQKVWYWYDWICIDRFAAEKL